MPLSDTQIADFAERMRHTTSAFDRCPLVKAIARAAAEVEREACARVCEARAKHAQHAAPYDKQHAIDLDGEAEACAEAIRERGE